jgi:type I restriction enzyme S subunit
MFEKRSWGDISELKYGRALSGYRENAGGEVPVYGTNGAIGFTNEPQVDRAGVIIGRKGAYRGVHYSARPFWAIDTAFYLVAASGIHDHWAYYSLKLSDINGLDSGSAIPSTTREAFASMPVLVPEYLEQVGIAEVLGALDDKIAANTTLAKTSDDLAVATFVSAAKNAAYTDATFADVARVSGGGTPSTKIPDFWGGDVSWATPTDITALAGPFLESTSRSITHEGLAACSSELFAPGAILMTSRATIGAFAVNQVPTAVNQGFIVVEPHDRTLKNWILHDMRSRVDEFVSMANGATFLELSRGNFKKFRVRIADEETMRSFSAQAEALHNVARHALRENTALAELRDTLLPELMSGRLRVKDAEQQVGEIV